MRESNLLTINNRWNLFQKKLTPEEKEKLNQGISDKQKLIIIS